MKSGSGYWLVITAKPQTSPWTQRVFSMGEPFIFSFFGVWNN
jgi:hypothetical protein